MLPLLPQLSDKEINLLNGIEYGDIPLITQSLDNTNANMIGPQNTTPLLIAIYNAMKMYNDEDRTRGDPERDIEIVKMLLEKGANVNETDERVRTAFLVAAWRGRKRIVEVLLEQEVDVDTTVPTTKFGGWTALIAVSVQGNPDIVKLLLDNGADMNAKDEKGNTALFHASGRGHAEIVEMLLDNEADMNAKDKNGQTALIEASEKGHAEIVVMLLEKGVNMNVDDNHVKVALITASGRGHKRVVEVLLDKGVDVNAIDTTFAGWTPLITASVRGYAEIVAMLLTRDGILVNAGDEHGRTALIFASNNGYIDIVKLLLDNGANVNAEDKGGNTALIFASNKGHTDIMELLKRPNLPPPPPPKGGKRKSRKSNKFNKKRT
jgi:serine/threonine-protein phosphatase 6 regulatory ankyrin repeat subunit B